MYAFTGPAQPVEVHHRGTWYSGELLGWRNESDGRCTARVRCVVGKLRHSAWVGLADLRLPEPGAVPAPNPPIDLGRPRPERAPAPAPAAPVLDDDTRPHEFLPRRTARPRPRPPAAPLPPPPRSYRQPAPPQYSHA
jgi:hypothetical protein